MTMERATDMKSPFTGGRVKEIFDVEQHEFRKETFEVHVRYFVCEDTGEKFTTTEQDELMFNELYAQYRVRHGIPFPEEIAEIRSRYGLNYTQISRILGFGANQYAQYEGGQMPSESNGKMIAAIRNKSVILSLLDGCRESMLRDEYEKSRSAIMASEARETTESELHRIIYRDTQRSIFNGFGVCSVEKLSDMVRYIVAHEGSIYPTKLNKLMFYADFHHYRLHGRSISGLQYQAINYGPVPVHYATVYDNIEGIDKQVVVNYDMESTLLSCSDASGEGNCSGGSLSEQEIGSIDAVLRKLSPLSTSQLVETSHQEDAWRNFEPTHSYIPYTEAFGLKVWM